MTTNSCDSLRNVTKGRTDWKVKVRIIREWRGVTLTGIVFKSYNLLLLDNKNCRMHAFVPATLTEKFSRMIQEGKIYLIKNFQVKDYTDFDKFRPVQMERQIIFTADTKVKDVDETEIFIPSNSFDFYEFGDVKPMAKQVSYLADVIGIIENKPKISRPPNKSVNVKFKISDGKNTIYVTFWGSFAEEFDKAMKAELEEPKIIIIASGKISTWNDKVDVSNYSPSRFFLNYDHHTVKKLRQMLKDPAFSRHQFARKKQPLRICTIDEIKKLGDDSVGQEVVCKAKLKLVEQTKNWKRHFCTSCYAEGTIKDNKIYCSFCEKFVVEPLKRYHVSTVAQDHSGRLEIVLKDREVRILLNKNVEEVQRDVHMDDSFPREIKALQGEDYTIRLLITKANIDKRDYDYVATGIIPGFGYETSTEEQQQTTQSTNSLNVEPSTSSYHLDDISQLNAIDK